MEQSDDALLSGLVKAEQYLEASTTVVSVNLLLLGLFSICFILIKVNKFFM